MIANRLLTTRLFKSSLAFLSLLGPVLLGPVLPGSTWLNQSSPCLMCSVPSAFALDSRRVDAQLSKMLDKIQSIKTDSDDYEKLEAANDQLLKYLKIVSVQHAVMADPLKMADDKGLSVYTSDDKKLRCYSWDTLTGGTMHNFQCLIVFDAGNRQLKCKVLNPSGSEGDPGSAFEGVDTIKTKDGKTVYLVRDLFIGSGLIHGRTISAYVIANGKLSTYPFFQAGQKLLKKISFEFAEYTDGTEFELSDDKKTLKVPLIKPAPADYPGSGSATGKFLNYCFNGSRFVFKVR